MKKVFSIVVALIAVCFFSTCTPAINYSNSIVMNNNLVAGVKNGALTNNSTVTSELENPIITGSISFNSELASAINPISSSVFELNSCCNRMLLQVPGNSKNLLSSAFISLLSTRAFSLYGGKLYIYNAPSVSLPSDGSAVNISLLGNDGVIISCTIALDQNVIVLPVYVHEFTSSRESLPRLFDQDNIASAFDTPSFITRAESIRQPDGSINTRIFTKHLISPYLLTDTIWKQAHIQFKLVKYITEPNDILEHQIISTTQGRFETDLIFSNYMFSHPDDKGIHIYIGRNSANLGENGGVIDGHTEQPLVCDVSGSFSPRLHIELCSDKARDRPNALAHELGHFLGLDHSDITSACGNALLDEGEDPLKNLMNTDATLSYHLSARQIATTRSIACQYLHEWGLHCPACSGVLTR